MYAQHPELTCPKCKANIIYDRILLMWICKNVYCQWIEYARTVA